MMSGAPTDAEAIAASRLEPSRFAQVFDRHYPPVYRWLRRRVGEDLAEELAAETFARAFDARARYDLRRPDARPWLYGIATNILRRHRRTERRRLLALARAAIDRSAEPDPGSPDGRVDAERLRSWLALALASLTLGERDVLLLFAWGDLSYQEIADSLGLPVGTVRSRLSRGRGKVRELLLASGQYVGEGEAIAPVTEEAHDG